jgi:membrane fusion protein, multidrug efflux system
MTDTISAATDSAAVRRRRLIGFGSAAILCAVTWTAWHLVRGNTLRSTDDAYVNGHVVSITPQVAGAVSAVRVDSSDRVQVGQVLVEIDSSDARIALASAQAELAQTLRRVRGLFAAEAQTAAMIQLRQAEVDRASDDLRARQSIVGQGAVTEEDARHARDAVKAARAAREAATQAHAEAFSQTKGTTVEDHPEVRAALEHVRAAALGLQRTTIRAPVAGMVALRSVQLGKRVAIGERLMAVVPLDQVWVDANFKEVQLAGVCPAQRARVTADAYGSHLIYHGTVDDIEAGSGAAFALLPAQNATGNWIKVVQRVPVRIRLDPGEVAQHPLRIGMSTEVDIDTRQCLSGRLVSRVRDSEQTSVYAAQSTAADEQVAAAVSGAAVSGNGAH